MKLQSLLISQKLSIAEGHSVSRTKLI